MALARQRTKYVGVYTRTCKNRQGQPDTAFDIVFRHNGKVVWRRVGMKSEGQTATAASRLRALILDDIAHGGDGATPLVRDGLLSATALTAMEAQKNCLTFDDAWQIWREKWGPHLSRNGKDEDLRYRLWIAPHLGKRKLDSITTLELENLKTHFLRKKFAASTVVKILGDVRRVYHKMTAWGLYEGKIPTTALVMPKVDNARTRFLTRDEAQRLLDALAVSSPVWHDIAWMSLHTGMRKGEILSLRRSDIDMETGQILVRDAKTGSRSLPLTDDVANFLRPRLPAKPRSLIFTGNNGNAIDPSTGATFRRVVGKLGLNEGITDTRHKVVFHSLRHTFCSWLAMAGVPLHTIAQLAGHSTTQMTARYSHLAPDKAKAAASLIGSLLNPSHTS